MLGALPVAMPEETLYSLCARTHRLLGYCAAERTSELLFGFSTAARLRVLPSNLAHFAAVTQGVLGSAQDVLRQRTLAGLTMQFADGTRSAAIVRICSARGTSRAVPALIARSAFSKPPNTLWACPRCAREGWQRHGARAWLLAHHWPGTYVCTVHGGPLLVAAVSSNCGLWLRPEDLAPQRQAGGRWEAARLFAARQVAAAMAAFQARALSPTRMRPHLADLLGQMGLIGTRWRPRDGQMQPWWEARQRPFLQLDPSLAALAHSSWIYSLVLGRCDDDPVKWAVLLSALLSEKELQEFLDACVGEQLPLFEGPQASASERRDALSMQAWTWLASGRPIGFVARMIGRSQASVRYWLQQRPAIAAEREQRLLDKQLRARRQLVARMLRRSPAAGRRELYAASPALVRWMEKNDRLWFASQLVTTSSRYRQRVLAFDF
jgi:hypothetical protein